MAGQPGQRQDPAGPGEDPAAEGTACPGAGETGGKTCPLRPPLSGRVALAALYRLWDSIDRQLRGDLFPPAQAGPVDAREPASRRLHLPTGDLATLHAAAAELRQPTAGLAELLARLAGRGQQPRALAALLAVLAPIERPDRRPHDLRADDPGAATVRTGGPGGRARP